MIPGSSYLSEILVLSALAGLYVIANWPFLALPCHQDAGWHSYWAKFRCRGVTLEKQLNVLMGCARLGSKFLYVLWFALFRERDPDRLTRIISWGASIAVALILYVGLTHYGAAWLVPAAAAGCFLAICAVPTLGLQYETAERTANLFHAVLFIAALSYLEASSAFFMGGIVFAMFTMALLFKITQLGEYFAVWILMFYSSPDSEVFAASVIGALGALLLFVLLLGFLGILKLENLGLIGYVTGWQKKNPAKDASSTSSGLRTVYQRYLNLRNYGPNVFFSLKAPVALALVGAASGEGPVHALALAWFAGGALVVLAQGRFLPFHFIPLVLPLSVLAAYGVVFFVGDGATLNVVSPLVLGTAILALALLDLRNLLWSRRAIPFDLRYLPPVARPIFEKNRLAEDAAAYVEQRTEPEDYVMVWGTLPQFFLLCDRRCPISWLSTNANLMSPILPGWREILIDRMRQTRPVYLLEADDDLDLEELRRQTGLRYEKEAVFGGGANALYHLAETTNSQA